MSTVRMSEYLKRDIVRKFEESHKKSKPQMELDVARGDAIYNEYIGSKISTAIEQLSETFGDTVDVEDLFPKKSSIEVTVPVHVTKLRWDGEEYVKETELDEDYNLTVPLSTERKVFYGFSNDGYYGRQIKYNFDRYENKDLNYLCEVVEYNSKLNAIRDLSAKKVEELLDKFTTLNQALKAWPALSKLVEPEKLAKVHEKQQRKRKQEQQKQMADQVVVDNDLNKTILSASLIGDE